MRPSIRSLVSRNRPQDRRSASIPAASGRSAPRFTRRLTARTASGALPAILAAMGLDHFSIDSPADEAALTGAIDRADAVQRPFVALIGRTVTA